MVAVACRPGRRVHAEEQACGGLPCGLIAPRGEARLQCPLFALLPTNGIFHLRLRLPLGRAVTAWDLAGPIGTDLRGDGRRSQGSRLHQPPYGACVLLQHADGHRDPLRPHQL